MPLMTIIFGNSIAQFNDYGTESSLSSVLDDKIHEYLYASFFLNKKGNRP